MMKTVTGKFREARLYLIYAVSPLRPGVEVPTFGKPREFKWKLDRNLSPDDTGLIIEEGRRQLDRQLSELEHIRGRAAALITLCLAELAALSAGANRVFGNHYLLIVVWALSVIAVLLSLFGAIAVLTSRATFGRIDTIGLAAQEAPLRRLTALTYAKSVGEGEETNATRVTVLRGAVLLAILGAILYAIVWPVATFDPAKTTPTPSSTSINGGTPCPTCTTSSPSPLSPTPSLQPSPTKSAHPQAPVSPHP